MVTTDTLLPLSGIRVIDWTIRQAGPSATQLLADMGAEVIKLERPKGGDSQRGATRDAGTWMGLSHGMSYGFEDLNRNKKSIVVDMTKEEGKKLVYALVAKSDVFVQNYRYGVAKKLNMDYETLQKYSPSIICANCTGYGTRGKQASQTAMDPAIHAASGMMLGIGEEGMPPIHLPGAMSDQTTGLMLAYAITTALLCRERTGIGQEVNVSMLGTMIWVQTNNVLFTLFAKKPRERQRRTKPRNPLVNYYCCKDGRWILFAMFQADKYWAAFCRVLGLEGLIEDPRFNSLRAREKNSAELIPILDKVFATRIREEWLQIFTREDLIYSPIRDYWEMVNDPQVLENGFIVEVDHPVVGKLQEIGIPVEFSKTPGSIRAPAPQLGQHTEEVLIDILGLSWEEIERLQDLRAI